MTKRQFKVERCEEALNISEDGVRVLSVIAFPDDDWILSGDVLVVLNPARSPRVFTVPTIEATRAWGKANSDLLAYGTGIVRVATNGEVSHIPVAELQAIPPIYSGNEGLSDNPPKFTPDQLREVAALLDDGAYYPEGVIIWIVAVVILIAAIWAGAYLIGL